MLGCIEICSALCPEDKSLHPNKVAGYVCYKGSDEEEILCDSNNDRSCTETNCIAQLGGYEDYTCGHANYYYNKLGIGEEILEEWIGKCCFEEAAVLTGCLAGIELSFDGECTYENVVSTASSHGCSEVELFAYLGTVDVTMSKQKVTDLCAEAASNVKDSFLSFSDIAASGYQFDREFMNGGSDWNNAFDPDLSRVQWVEDDIYTKRGITYPNYLHNFKSGDDDYNCESNAVMCCWTSDSRNVGHGSCTDSEGCQDAEPVDNTDVCYVNIEDSYLASHTKNGVVVFPGDTEGNVNCMGFTWKDDKDDPSSLYKGNLLFEVAMRYGLKENGYTRSVPHAPLCGCVEQMPVVSRADCKNVEATNTWSFAPDEVTGLLTVWQSAVDLEYNDCSGLDLASQYLATHNTTISHRITGECAAKEESFLASKGYAAQNVKWVKIAGKGIYADPDNEEHTEKIKDGTHTSMSRADFEKVWATSADQILMRLCLHCTKTHRYAYLKRYDENGLPPNVDILDMVKENWKQYENNTAHEDFELFFNI